MTDRPEQSKPPVHIALCDRDDCAWKHRGVTAEATADHATRHVLVAGHTVTLYEDHRVVAKVL